MEKHGVVYCLTDGTNSYIGSTFDLKTRKLRHQQVDYLKKILKNKNHRYDIMEEGVFTKRQLLDLENEYIENNDCINKRKPLKMFKNKQHRNMLNWGKQYMHCDACNCEVTRWNWCKHEQSVKHQTNADKNGEPVLNGGQITYMRAVAIYNKQKKQQDENHKHFIPKKGTPEQEEVFRIFREHV